MSKDLNEFLTRKQRIDIMLKEQGWVVGEKEKIIVEVDTKQSDFRAQNYRTVSDTLNDMESKYVDYLLLDIFGAPLAIIEVFSQNKGTRIKDAFNTYVIDNSKHYSANQLNFIRTIQTVFTKKKHIEYEELFDAPFSNFGINAPMPMFTENELNEFINICGSAL